MFRLALRAVVAAPGFPLAGAIVFAIGTVLAASTSERDRLLAVALLATGTLLASWTGARLYGQEQARQELRGQLDTLNQDLATVCSQIRDAVDAAADEAVEPSTAFALVSQSTGMLFGIMNRIQAISGNPLNPSQQLAIVEGVRKFSVRLKELSSRAVALATVTDEAEKLQPLVTQLDSQIEAFQKSLTQGQPRLPKPLVTARCPECSTETQFSLGTSAGDSASPTCPNGHRFNAHRSTAGLVLLRGTGPVPSRGSVQLQLPGTTPAVARATKRGFRVVCPNSACPGIARGAGRAPEIPVRVRAQEGTEIRFCLDCGWRLAIDAADGRIAEAKAGSIAQGRTVGEGSGQALIVCPTCERRWRAFARRDNSVFAVCAWDQQLIVSPQIRPMPGEATSTNHGRVLDSAEP